MTIRRPLLSASLLALSILTIAQSPQARILPAADSIWSHDYSGSSGGLWIHKDSITLDTLIEQWNDGEWVRWDSVDFGSCGFKRVFINGGAGFYDCQHKLIFMLDNATAGTVICTLTVAMCGDWYKMQYDPGLIINNPSGIHNVFIRANGLMPDGTIWSGGFVNLHSFIFTMPTSTASTCLPSVSPVSRNISPPGACGYELAVSRAGVSALMPAAGDYRLSVIGIDGKTVADVAVVNSRSARAPLSAPPGIYIATIRGSGAVVSRPFTVDR